MKTSTRDWVRLRIFSLVFFVLNNISTWYSIWDTWISLSYEIPHLSIFLNSLAGIIPTQLPYPASLNSFTFCLHQFFIFSSLLKNKTIFWFLIVKHVYLHILYLTLTSEKHLCDMKIYMRYYHQLWRDSYHSTCMDAVIMKRRSNLHHNSHNHLL